jgi:hypothetical protein
MAKRMSLLAVVAVLLVPAAVASADSRPPPPKNCNTHFDTAQIHVSYIGAVRTSCDTAVDRAHRYAASGHCVLSRSCTFGHLGVSCETKSVPSGSGDITHHAVCKTIDHYEEVHVSWHFT